MGWDLIGHEWAVKMLQGQLARDQLNHAFLITGPQGIGRRTLALRLAQAVNCTYPPEPGVACQSCRSCQQIGRMQHPDLSIVQAEQVGGTLKVDQVRELQRSLSLAPYEARYKVAILLRFEEAHLSAANALLKTLEEPPDSALLLLTAESAENLLETIVSRCEVLRLRPLTVLQVQAGLQQRWDLNEEDARLLAHISNGRLGFAVQLHQDVDFMEQRREWLEALVRLLSYGRVDRFHFAEKASKDRAALRLMLTIWLTFWRDVLLVVSAAKIPLTNLDFEHEIREIASGLNLATSQIIVARIEDLITAVDANANTRLVLEVLMIEFPQLSLA